MKASPKEQVSYTCFIINFDLSGVFSKPFSENVIRDICTGCEGDTESFSTLLLAEEKAVMEFIVDLNQLMSTDFHTAEVVDPQ